MAGDSNRKFTCWPPRSGKDQLFYNVIILELVLKGKYSSLVATYNGEAVRNRLEDRVNKEFGKVGKFLWEQSINHQGKINENVYRLEIEV